MPGVHLPAARRGLAAAAVVVLLAGCNPTPTPAPSSAVSRTLAPGATATAPTPTTLPSPTAAATGPFSLAVVTGLTNHKSVIKLDELATLATSGKLVVPCGVDVRKPALKATAPCVAADQIVAAIGANQKLIALLPPGLVEPATKVLPIAGDGPYGLFGPDMFGNPASRALPYPVIATASAGTTLDPTWTAFDATQVWTLTETGSLCADRGAARQAVTLHKGWDWVFDGGTAKYKGPPIPNPNPPPGIDRHPIVRPVETGNDGATAKVFSSADVTLGNLKCPVLPTSTWKPANQALGLSVPEDVLTRWESFLGIDAVYLAADHQSDRGVRGIKSTLQLIDKHGFSHTGLGLNLDGALEPAYVEVAGLKVAFVAWNNVPGPTHAGATTPGVAWLNQSNVVAAVNRAKAGGADLIVCDPQWWGPDEYRPDLSASQKRAVGWMDAAGCDQILAGGLHLSGGMYLRPSAKGVSMVDVGPGNYQYGQDFWQNTQEGVIVEQVYRGTTLVNVRLHPYVMILAARAALLDPAGDGHYVLDRIFKVSELDYRGLGGG
jgi:Bacterial capsule synthesis protein PGA_cap.